MSGCFGKMTEETQKRLRPKFDQMIGLFAAMSGSDSYEDAIAMLRQQFQDKNTSPAPWLHKIARQMNPADQPDSVDPELFYEILSLIDTEEKALAVFNSLPEEGAPQIEDFFSFLLNEFFPSMKSDAHRMAKRLPQRRDGGRPSTVPGDEECQAICNEISKLERDGLKRGDAQRRLAARKGLKLRTIQRIWAARNKYSKSIGSTEE